VKIIHFDTDDLDNPLGGGQPVRTFHINSRLARRHEITVFTSTYEQSVPAVQRAGVSYRRLGFGIKGLGLSHHLSFLAASGPRVLRTPHDLVVEEFSAPFGFCSLPYWTGRPVILMVQSFPFKVWEARYRLPFERIMRGLASWQRYKAVIVQTDCMEQRFRKLMPRVEVHRVPCGIPASALRTSDEPGGYALFLGRIYSREKGLNWLLDAWADLQANDVRIPLRIAGDGPDLPELRRQVKDRGLAEIISFEGRVAGDFKDQLIAGARFLVMPSLHETFGISALEGMAASKPVIASDIDNLNEVVRRQWGLLVKPGDVKGLAVAVNDLWSKPAAALELGRRAYIEASQYTWDRLALLQEQIYLRAANQHLKEIK